MQDGKSASNNFSVIHVADKDPTYVEVMAGSCQLQLTNIAITF